MVVLRMDRLIFLSTTWFLDEPKGQIAEVAEDGTVHLIDVG